MRFKNRANDKTMKNGRVQMESEKFNQSFDVFAEDAHDAFYLLTPHFMEQMVRLQKKYTHISIKFRGNQVVVGFHDSRGSNSFDKVDWANKVEYHEELAKVQDDINDVKNIINMICSPERKLCYNNARFILDSFISGAIRKDDASESGKINELRE